MKVEKLLNIARAEIGTTEWPSGSNKVKYNTWYYGQEVYDGLWGTTFAWCMAFVQWCYHQAGSPILYKTASCDALLRWYRHHFPDRVFMTPQPGDIMILTGHTGLVEAVDGEYVITIEGNTSPSDSGSQYNGGCVARKKRKISTVLGFIRPVDFENETPKPVIIEKEDEEDMTKEQILEKLGDRYITTFAELPEWAKPDMRELLDSGIINGGTSAEEDPDDIRMFLSDIKAIIVAKRMMAR